GVIHSNVFTKDEDPYFIHSDLNYDTDYSYQVRAVNTKGASEWSKELTVKTDLDPYRNVPENMTATASSYQPGEEPEKAIDGDDNTQWHSEWGNPTLPDRKSTRLNSSHVSISYAVFCLKKKKKDETHNRN